MSYICFNTKYFAEWKKVRITKNNISKWQKFEKLLSENKVKFDNNERLRYLHGAPVGDMFFVRKDKNGSPVYKESAEEWFDPESQKARDFVWL